MTDGPPPPAVVMDTVCRGSAGSNRTEADSSNWQIIIKVEFIVPKQQNQQQTRVVLTDQNRLTGSGAA